MRYAGEVPSSIGKLTNLRTLSLSNNKFNELPSEIRELGALEELEVVGNNLRKPPQAIAEQGIQAIRSYFTQHEREG